MAAEHGPSPRRPASAVPSIQGLLVSPPGAKATLVDISATGLLAECGVALKVGQPVTVYFEGTFSPQSIEAQVIRTSVSSMSSSGFRYHVGMNFASPIAFDDESPPEKKTDKSPAPAAVADPPTPAPVVVNRW